MEKIMTIEEMSSKFDGQIHILKHTFGIADFMVLKCAVDLQLADIIHSNAQPMTLSQIACRIGTSTNQGYLERVMRMLVRLKIFTHQETKDNDGKNVVLYGETPSSMALLSDSDVSVAPYLHLQHNLFSISSWYHLSNCVREGGSGFKKAHGCELFERASIDLELNKTFNLAMKCFTKIFAQTIFSVYREEFSAINGVNSVVDVGGGMGHLIVEIVKEFPHMRGINFDLPHVVALGPVHHAVSHVPGCMFNDHIPHADVVLLKQVLHNWGDEECITILKNCKKAIKDKGKIIIIDLVLREEGEEISERRLKNIDVIMDLLMMVMLPGGKERTKKGWKMIIEEAGFQRFNFISTPFLATVIELHPQ